MFGVHATSFAVLVGFVVFLAFESYDTSRSGAEAEAELIAQQFQTAQLLSPAVRSRISGEIICYARSVVHQEWPAMEAGHPPDLNPWGVAMFQSLRSGEPRSPSEQAAYSKWLDQTTDRQSARGDRLHGAEGVIPLPLWIVLLLSATVVLGFMLLFADSAERAFVQASMMAAIVIVIVSMLLLLRFLDDPFARGIGGLRPVAMERTVRVLDEQAAIVGRNFRIPCDAQGVAHGG